MNAKTVVANLPTRGPRTDAFSSFNKRAEDYRREFAAKTAAGIVVRKAPNIPVAVFEDAKDANMTTARIAQALGVNEGSVRTAARRYGFRVNQLADGLLFARQAGDTYAPAVDTAPSVPTPDATVIAETFAAQDAKASEEAPKKKRGSAPKYVAKKTYKWIVETTIREKVKELVEAGEINPTYRQVQDASGCAYETVRKYWPTDLAFKPKNGRPVGGSTKPVEAPVVEVVEVSRHSGPDLPLDHNGRRPRGSLRPLVREAVLAGHKTMAAVRNVTGVSSCLIRDYWPHDLAPLREKVSPRSAAELERAVQEAILELYEETGMMPRTTHVVARTGAHLSRVKAYWIGETEVRSRLGLDGEANITEAVDAPVEEKQEERYETPAFPTAEAVAREVYGVIGWQDKLREVEAILEVIARQEVKRCF